MGTNSFVKLGLSLATAAVLFTGCVAADDENDTDNGSSTQATLTFDNAALTVGGNNEKDLTLSASSSDSDASLSYSLKTTPSKGVATIDADTGVLTYQSAEKGTYTLDVQVSDGTNTKTATVTITVENSAPTINNASISKPTAYSSMYQVSASDYDGDGITYAIKTEPTTLDATINTDGVITFTNLDANYTTDSLVVTATDSVGDSSEATISVGAVGATTTGDSLKSQFYKVTNPDTTNSQIVHYDSETGNQIVIKDNVILNDKVFVMSGTKDGEAVKYNKREYGIFLDPGSNSETRQADDGSGGTYDYEFYTDYTFKKFSLSNTGEETTIFSGDSLKKDIKNSGLNVISDTSLLFLNELDIDNSYVMLKAFDKLADTLKGELSDEMLHTPITVRLSDGAHTLGKPIAIIKNTDGTSKEVLVNFVYAHKHGAYPSGDDKAKRLQVCDTALSTCTDIEGTNGNYFYIAQNDSHIYMLKKGSDKIFAYDKSAQTVATVSGVTYPAAFNHEHHETGIYSSVISSDRDGATAHYSSKFWNLLNSKITVSEGSDAYLAINYDLDLEDVIATNPYAAYGWNVYSPKSAMILKLTGTSGLKVYDNGDGIDNMNASDDDDISYHINLVAVKNGSLFIEAAKYNVGEDINNSTCNNDNNCMTYKQGWLDTDGQTTTKTDFDNTLVDRLYPYFSGIRVAPPAFGDYVYVTDTNGTKTNKATRNYYIYKMPMDDTSIDTNHSSVTPLEGRMYLETTAVRGSGINEGGVIVWKHDTGNVVDASNDVIVGNDDVNKEDNETDFTPYAVTANSSSDSAAGYGGMFGLHMTPGHGDTPFLNSGETNTANSLKKVNQIEGSWIIH